MRGLSILLATAACLMGSDTGWALDAIKTTAGKTINGRITSMGRLEVQVERGPVVDKIPVNQIASIVFEEEPSVVKGTVRTYLRDQRYGEALEALGKVRADTVTRKEVQQELSYLRAMCAAKLALAGSGTVQEAGREMFKFVSASGDSYHYLEACELLGDLLVAAGSYAKSEPYYAQVAAAPWPEYKMRASVAVGRAQLAQGKTAEALKSFESVLASDVQGELADTQRLIATIGKARCLSEGQQQEEAVKLVEDTLSKIDPEQADLNAMAYNSLGTAKRKAGQTKEALFAFLHVELLYASAADAHAEALANLSELWTELQKPDRAATARRTLEERYPNSRWAKAKSGASKP